MRYTTSSIERGGISQLNRDRLTRLHRKIEDPFSIQTAMQVLQMDRPQTQRLLAHLAAQGWLVRVNRGKYATVPIEAARPEQWRVEPWLVATENFAPCYIGGWSACEHWDLTEQIFRTIVVISASPHLRKRSATIQGTQFLIKQTSEEKLFGTRPVWVERQKVSVSDPSRSIIDILDDPALGGGIRHVLTALDSYLNSEHRRDQLLLDYTERLGNRTVYKRLGYLIEALGIAAPNLISACLLRKSAGYSLLDPGSKNAGPLLRRWNLRINVHIPVRVNG